jgi:7-cyano-7-deazaguanine reductase
MYQALGKITGYPCHYDKTLLQPIPRHIKRDEMAVPDPLPFYGEDLWNAYEVSWLNPQGKPMLAIAECRFGATSVNIIESKSFKLYLNSLSQTPFESLYELQTTLTQDLSEAVLGPTSVLLTPLHDYQDSLYTQLPGRNIDHLNITCHQYQPDPSILKTEETFVSQTLCSDLLKSNCLVTGQPDWGSIQIQYEGPRIDESSLLRYIVSFREHEEFHEQCVERIYMDILNQCRPQSLTVYARYMRRGGLDINPYRSSDPQTFRPNIRLIRQ